MRVTLLTAGSRGDVQPYVALAVGLEAAGYRAKIATNDSFQEFVAEFGLEYAQVSQPPRAIRSNRLWRRWQQSGENLAGYIYYFLRIARQSRPTLEAMLDDFWSACQGAELIISSTSGFGGPAIAEMLGVPHCWAFIHPMIPTRAFPHFMTPYGLSLGARLNRLTYLIAERVYWLLFGPALRRWQRAFAARPAIRRPHSNAFLGQGSAVVLCGFSRHVVPPPADWDDRVKLCGYWHLDAPAGWQPPPELIAFLENGPPPVYFSLSGVHYPSREGLVDLVLEALRRTGRRGVLQLGFAAERLADLPDYALPVGAIPHDWLFPRMAAVVHHGGVGTTANALRAGIPSVGVPSYWDQPFWSRRAHRLGVGPKPIPVRQLNGPRLVQALEVMASDSALQRRARTVGEKIRQEDGVASAVYYLEAYGRPASHKSGYAVPG
jgi:sterol 3beta-glucosyltransferase